MNVNQLKDELRKQKMSTNGERAMLQGRLLGAMNVPVVTGESCEEPIAGFAPEAKWIQLT